MKQVGLRRCKKDMEGLCHFANRSQYTPRTGVHKTGIRGIQDTRQIVNGKTNDIENNDKKVGPNP